MGQKGYSGLRAGISRFFDLDNNGTDIRTEVLAGLTTFMATMYIIVVNPAIVQQSGMPFPGILAATVLVAAFSSIAMGLYANNPLVVAPGMSLNHLFAALIVKTQGVPWATALGCVFWSGVLFLLLACCDRRKWLISTIPRELRLGFAAGIGLFIALVGLENAGLAVAAGGVSSFFHPLTLIFLAGLITTAVAMARNVTGSFILGILATTLLAWTIGRWWGDAAALTGSVKNLAHWTGWFSLPDFSLLLCLDVWGALRPGLFPIILLFLFSCLFDSLGTCVGVCEAGNLVDEEGVPRRIDKSLRANALGVFLSPLLGSSPATAYIESSAGMREGGRTGLTAVVAGLMFLPFLFFSPLLSLVPSLATAPVLVLVGVFMMKPVIYVRWDRYEESIPFFLSMIVMPLGHSISLGIVWGCLSWTAIKVGCGKWRQVPVTLWIVDAAIMIVLVASQGLFH